MPMNPRLLRPTASGFNPRQIGGLALWLDAADASTLRQNSDGTVAASAPGDPVGYWADKSGNGRHATQATAARRPAISATSQNGKQVTAFTAANAGLTDGSVLVSSTGGQQLKDAVTVVTAAFMGSINFSALWSLGNSAPGQRWSGGAVFGRWSADWLTGTLDSGFSGANRTTLHTARFDRVANTVSLRLFGGTLQSVTASPALAAFSNDAITIGAMPALNEQYINGRVFEVLMYNRALSVAECRRIEQYLAAKWGITLAPQVSNADAQDWVNRVYANGGTVSASTATAVNSFCDAIDAAGIRDRFFRLNLFAGTGLNAALVPLYRGPTRTGTQYGNTTDTNNGPFVSGDYTETGASGGLKGNGSNKYLNTGVRAANLPTAATGHLSAWGRDATGGRGGWLTAFGTSYSSPLEVEYNNNDGNTFRAWGREAILGTTPGSVQHLLVSRTSSTSQAHYNNGTLVDTNTTSTTPTATNVDLCCFVRNANGTFEAYSNVRLNAYSIGDSLTASQVTSFYNALSTFLATLGRT